MPIWAFDKVAGRFLKKGEEEVTEEEEEEEEEVEEVAGSSSGVDDFEVLEKVKTIAQNGNGRAVKRNKKSSRGR